jgi:hypothetical protein
MRYIVRTIIRGGIGLVVAGPVSQLTTLEDENSATEWKKLARMLHRLCERTGVTFVIAHHSRKLSDNAPKNLRSFFQTARGSSALAGMIDSGIGIDKEPDKNEGHLWSIQREDSDVPSRQYFTVDEDTLRFTISADPVKTETKISALEGLLYEKGWTNSNQLAAELKHTPQTMRNWVRVLGPNRIRTDKKSSPYRFDLTDTRRAEIAANRGEEPTDTDSTKWAEELGIMQPGEVA